MHSFIEALTSLVEQRDGARGDHSSKVANLLHQVALKMGISAREAQMIHLAGQVHDIGKIRGSDAILQKQNGNRRNSIQRWAQM